MDSSLFLKFSHITISYITSLFRSYRAHPVLVVVVVVVVAVVVHVPQVVGVISRSEPLQLYPM